MTRRMLLKQSLAAAGLLLVDSGSLCESQDAPRSNANDGALLSHDSDSGRLFLSVILPAPSD